MPISIEVKVGRRIRRLRTKRGMTQVILADHAELTPEYIGIVERGEKAATIKVLDRIVAALGVTLSEFFDGI